MNGLRYLKFPDGFPAAPVKLTPVNRPKRCDPFIRRANEQRPDAGSTAPPVSPRRPSGGGQANDEHPASNDDGAGKPVIAMQRELPLTDNAMTIEDEADLNANRKSAHASQAPTDIVAPTKPVSLERPSDPQGIATADGPKAAMPMVAVLRAEASEREPTSTDSHVALEPPSVMQQKPQSENSVQQLSARSAKDARKMMLEDGLAERPEVDLGDLDMDKGLVTTLDAIALEQRIIAGVEEGRGTVRPIIDANVAGERLQALGVPPHGVLALALSGQEELAVDWMRRDMGQFWEELLLTLPSALSQALGDDVSEIRPRWAAGTSRLVAKLVSEHVRDVVNRDLSLR